MSTEVNKALVMRMTEEFWNTGNMALIDNFFSADYVGHEHGKQTNLKQFKEAAAAYFGGFPDLHITTDDLVAEGDKVTKRWTARCTHTGDYMGIPATGNKLVVTGIEIFRISDGKIVELWANIDSLGMLQQLGVIPPLG